MEKALIERMDKLNSEAIESFGFHQQVDKTCEELHELLHELEGVGVRDDMSKSSVIDEIADVLVVAMKMRLIAGASEVDARIRFKLDRLESILEGRGA